MYFRRIVLIWLGMNQLLTVSLIAVAGAVGALARYGTSVGMKHLCGDGFPVGTLVVNVVGCFLLGILAQLGEQQVSPHLRLIVGVGFLGAFTTFSTFGVETVSRFQQGETGVALGNVALNLLVGLGAVVLGMSIAKYFQSPPL